MNHVVLARLRWKAACIVLGERGAWLRAMSRSDNYLGRYAIGAGHARFDECI